MSRFPLASRTASFQPFEANAPLHLASLGITRVEVHAPAAADGAALRATLSAHGLSVGSFQVNGELDRPELLETLSERFARFAEFSCQHALIPAKLGSADFDAGVGRLREAADLAAVHGITLMLETHPPLAENAAVSLRTIAAVDRANFGINFDPANVYFYNQGADAIGELEPIAEHVVGVHLKDTPGGYRQWNFPALGRGIVDFPALFRVLDTVGFDGPYTLEIEGIEGETPTEPLVVGRIAESLGYLRGLGRV